ncbi:MAG: response regulator [Gammaproteobacteria bacterium]|nr:response regulator [Gammaproteobacteria bacterium]MDH5693321.1 response regulator [Gammaproteobacteria bacterium]
MRKVLVVEDNPNNMELVTFILKASGFEILEAERGIVGVELFCSDDPDLVLLDIQLPDIDGIEVLRRMRQTEKGNSVPIIAVTSYAMTGDSGALVKAGCDGYIEKPIDPERFIEQVTTILERKGRHAELS